MNFIGVIISAVLIISLSFVGKIATVLGFEKRLQKNISLLASFSAGVFVIVVFRGITEAAHEISIVPAIVAALLGFLVVTIASIYIPESHHHHDDDAHHHNRKGVWKILFSDAIHNIVDGIALVLSFSVSVELGIAMAVSIFAHEFVQELGEYFALRSYGLNQRSALVRNFLVALTLFIGVGIGLLINGSGALEPWMLAISAGTFISVIVFDLLPPGKSGMPMILKHIAAALWGALILLSISAVMPHSHQHDNHNHSHDFLEHEINESDIAIHQHNDEIVVDESEHNHN